MAQNGVRAYHERMDDRFDPEVAATWRFERDLVADLLADIRAGLTKMRYSPDQIAGLERERDRYDALLRSYEAAQDA